MPARWPTDDHDVGRSTNMSNTDYTSPRNDFNTKTATLKLRGNLPDGHGGTVVTMTGVPTIYDGSV
jgi:hypothetical protein